MRAGGFGKAWVLILAFALAQMGAAVAGTPPGTVISNTGSLTYTAAGGNSVVQHSNTVTTTVVSGVPLTPPSVIFTAYAPGSPAASGMPAGPTYCSLDGGASFSPLPNPSINGSPVNPDNSLPLAPTTIYGRGDVLFIQLTDPDQNVNPLVRDTVVVTVSVPALNEAVTLKLTETGPNTGVFVGYVPTSTSAGSGCALQVGPNASVQVSYTDPLSDDQVTTAALVDPYGVVFDSSSGKPVNGASVTLVDATTGQPAQVYGKDGVSSYPSTVTSGTTVTDSSGAQYDVPAGGFVFPQVKPGNYRVEIIPPKGYHAPSTVSVANLETLPGAPYTLPAASFGGELNVPKQGIVRIDLPIDPMATNLFLQKTASQPQASVGDFMQFTLTLQNANSKLAADGVSIMDLLPQGFRYVKGSALLGNGSAVEPVISPNGQQLTFPVGTVPAASTVTVTYAVELTAATPLTTVVNSAQAFEGGDGVSNIATAAVLVQSDFLQNVNTIVGRVVVGCDIHGGPGVAGARVVMEDGSYAITDKDGNYHFPEVTNGTHVVQLDLPSLPKGYEPMSCEQNTRWAGRDFSQFVEVHGGALWRADFHVRPIPGATGSLGLQLMQAPAGNDVRNTVKLTVSDVPVTGLSAMVSLPQGMTYVAGSARLDGSKIGDPANAGGTLVFRLGARAAGWKGVIEFDTRLPGSAPGKPEHAHKFFIIEAFPSGYATLSAHARTQISEIAHSLDTPEHPRDVSMTFVGYTDDWPMRPGSKYPNNLALSVARAQAVVNYLRVHYGLQSAKVSISGLGKRNPVASNATAEGRAENRRTEITLEFDLTSEAQAFASAPLQTGAYANFDSPSAKNQHTPLAVVVLHPQSGQAAGPIFAPQSVSSEIQHAVVKGLSPAAESGANPQQGGGPGEEAATDSSKLGDQFAVNTKWLQTEADGTPQFIFPTTAFLPAVPSIHVAVEHGPHQKVALSVNGAPVDKADFLGVMQNSKHSAAVSEWLGVPLKEGDNTLVAVVSDGKGVVKRLEQKVHYSGAPVRAEFLAAKSVLLADGRASPVFAVQFFDRWGYPARRGLVGHYQINLPFQAYQSVTELQQKQVSAVAPREPSFVIGADGIALLKLAPTTATGVVTVTVQLAEGVQEQLRGWMKPADRDWILVGVASGTAAFNKIKNNMQSVSGDDPNSDIYQDGRVAFYAKGTIKGEYLLTAAYDSAKAGGVVSNGLQQAINPNTYFMLYGDASQEGFDAPTSSKLYLRIERNQFYAMFGDFTTGLTVTDLSRYDRLFNGVKSAYDGEHFGYTAFAARNDQAYVKDEIQGNGTSGLYHLSHTQLLINSERVSIETRDRYTNAVISTQQLTPFVDYTIDYFNGTIYFKQPVPARDQNFNPVYIVAEYEVLNGAGNAVTAGGRAYVRSSDGRVELGVTAVNEGTGDGSNRLTGTDLRVRVSQSTVLKAELAHTSNGPNGALGSVSNPNGLSVATGTSNTSNSSGNAYSVDVRTAAQALENDLYLKDEDASFGLGQQSLGDQGMRRLGDQARYHVNQSWSLTGQIQRQQSLAQDITDDVAQGGVLYRFNSGDTLGAGLLHAQDSFPSATPTLLGGNALGDYSSNQVTVNGSYGMLNHKLVVHGNVAQSVGGSADDPQYPNLADVGLDYKLTPKATLFADQQVANGGQQSARTTVIGAKTSPWENGEFDESVSQQYTEYGPRLFSTMGLTQGWAVNPDLSLQAGYNRVASMHSPSFPATSASTAPAVGALTQDFNSLFVGGSYHRDAWAMNGRVETLNSASTTSRNLFAGFYRTLSQGEAFSASLRAFYSRMGATGASDTVDGRLGYAFRADDSRWSWLDQLDFIFGNQQGLQGLPQFANSTGVAVSQESASSLANNLQSVSTYGINMRNSKLVNNLQGNYTVPGRYELSLYYGSKFARYTFDTGSYHDYTDLVGSEFRYDLSDTHDIGVVLSREHSWSAGVYNSQIGIETGWTLGTNMWLSLGYNFAGFYDQDFTASHYTAQGLFLRFRFKFDQDTVKAMASPGKPGMAY